jgi:hypothetical protein
MNKPVERVRSVKTKIDGVMYSQSITTIMIPRRFRNGETTTDKYTIYGPLVPIKTKGVMNNVSDRN